MALSIQRTLAGTYVIRLGDGEFILRQDDLRTLADRAAADGLVGRSEPHRIETAAPEAEWAYEAAQDFRRMGARSPDHAWRGREAEYIAQSVAYKRKVHNNRLEDERKDALTKSLRVTRNAFSRSGNYRSYILIETGLAMLILTSLTSRSEPWTLTAVKALIVAWLFHIAHTWTEGRLRGDEKESEG